MRMLVLILATGLALLATLGALPPALAESRAATLLLAGCVTVTAAWLGRRWAAGLDGWRGRLALGAAVPVLALLNVAVLVHLPLPLGVGGTTGLAARAAPPPESPYDVHVVGHGWHTGLVLATAALDAGDWPLAPELKARRWVELGWGDADFFQAEDPGVLTALDALVLPGPSVLHVASFDEEPRRYFAGMEVLRIGLGPTGFRNLVRRVAASFALDAQQRPVTTGPGDYGPESRFVKANGLYYFPHTCNVWTAEMLAAGGAPVAPAYAVTARNLMLQLRPLSRRAPPLP